jgi:Flp pilus assembly secretin CpaC
MLKTCLWIALAAWFSSVSGASAAEQARLEPLPASQYDLKLGVTQKMTLPSPFSAIAIGDPKVVDVKQIADTASVFLIPKSIGKSSIIFLDKQNDVISSFIVSISEITVRVHGDTNTDYHCSPTGCELIQVEKPTEAQQATPTTVQP